MQIGSTSRLLRLALYPDLMDYRTHPVDAASFDRLAREGLHLELVDTDDEPGFRRWLEVEARGFHLEHQSPELLAEAALAVGYRRTTAVVAPRPTSAPVEAAESGDDIVGTVSSFPVELTVPGERQVTAWAISAVTVAATHRRRGIARALLESELRTAHALGIPVAALTVSEATIYGRFGFAPAARAADLTIDTRRATWIGPTAPGRLRFVSAEQLLADADAILERAGLALPGAVTTWPRFHRGLFNATPATSDRGKKYRFVRYDDLEGTPQGYGAFQLNHEGDDYSHGVLTVEMLVSATPDAYVALWRFMLEMDLVTTVTAPLRSIDEPLLWQVADMRGIRVGPVRDHLWTRILDVEKALAARRYAGPAHIVFDVVDDLGFATGVFDLAVDAAGTASVTRLREDTESSVAPARVALSVSALSALYLGGTRATTLAAAGVIAESVPASAAAVDRAFASDITPWLSFWF